MSKLAKIGADKSWMTTYAIDDVAKENYVDKTV
jgi:hypothetical protein